MIHNGEQMKNKTFWEGLPGRRERTSMMLWLELCKTSHVILDVGANVGRFRASCSNVSPSAHILAFEPIPDVFRRMQENYDLNGFDAKSPQVALSDRDGAVRMTGLKIDNVGNEIKARRLDNILDEAHLDRID